MIYKNAELYNVSELLLQDDESYSMLRVPLSIENKMEPSGRNTNRNGCGNEIRFNLNGEKAKIRLKFVDATDRGIKFSRALVYYGSIAAGNPECVKDIGEEETTIELINHGNYELLENVSKKCGYVYDPKLIRLVFDPLKVNLIDIEGDITPPRVEQVPSIRHLAYGSSITYGAHGILATNSYAAHTARLLKADLINLGFAGAARLEKGIADYIAARDDWNFASLEMGINILNIAPDDYRKRVEYFIKKIAMAHPSKKIFCIDVFYCYSDIYKDGRAEKFREILKDTVCRLNFSNVVYVNGLDILDGSYGLASDMLHPNNTYTSLMGRRLAEIMKKQLII